MKRRALALALGVLWASALCADPTEETPGGAADGAHEYIGEAYLMVQDLPNAEDISPRCSGSVSSHARSTPTSPERSPRTGGTGDASGFDPQRLADCSPAVAERLSDQWATTAPGQGPKLVPRLGS